MDHQRLLNICLHSRVDCQRLLRTPPTPEQKLARLYQRTNDICNSRGLSLKDVFRKQMMEISVDAVKVHIWMKMKKKFQCYGLFCFNATKFTGVLHYTVQAAVASASVMLLVICFTVIQQVAPCLTAFAIFSAVTRSCWNLYVVTTHTDLMIRHGEKHLERKHEKRTNKTKTFCTKMHMQLTNCWWFFLHL